MLFSVAMAASTFADDIPPNVAREIGEIQQSLGGSVVKGFEDLFSKEDDERRERERAETLRRMNERRTSSELQEPWGPKAPPMGAGPVWSSDLDEKSREARLRVEALREAAANLDEMANVLERLELYSQADALREQAQRLRVDARELNGARLAPRGTDNPSSEAPSLDVGPVPMQERPASGEFHAPPLFAPEEGRRPMPENARPDAGEGGDLPQLEPVPGGERPQTDELQPVPTPGAPRVGDEELTPAPLSE